MIIVLERGTTPEEEREVLDAMEELGLRGTLLDNLRKPVVHVTQGPTFRARRLTRLDRVETVLPTSGPRIRRQGRRFYPYHFINWSSAAFLMMGGLVLMAGFDPPGVGPEIDPHVPPPGVGAPWFFRAPLAFVRLFPWAWLGWLALGLVLAALFFLPHLDRSRGNDLRTRAPVLLAGAVLALAWILSTFPGVLG